MLRGKNIASYKRRKWYGEKHQQQIESARGRMAILANKQNHIREIKVRVEDFEEKL